MERVTSSLETLIGIIKATEKPQPTPPTLNFDPVTAQPSSTNPNTHQFAFVGHTSPAPTDHQFQPPPVQQQPGDHSIPRPFPSHDHPVGGNEGQVSSSVYLEPQKLPEVWFSGDTKQLAPFLRVIRDFLYPRQAFFTLQSRMIVWISRHFGYRPSEVKNRNNPSAAENWFNSLILSNARAQGENNPYADLDRLPFLHPMLVLVKAFENGLINMFGDKFQMDLAKKALAACKQGKSSVEEYNAKFSTLCYQVKNLEDACIDKYVEGLNYDIITQAMLTEWLEEPTLAGKMRRALNASRQLAALSKIPNRQTSTHAPSTSNHRPAPFVPPPQVYQHPNAPSRSPDAMDIDAVSASRACMLPLFTTHFATGPYQRGELSQRESNSGSQEEICGTVPICGTARPEDARPSMHSMDDSLQPDDQQDNSAVPQDSQLGFEDFQEEVEEVGVSTIHVCLDCSKAGRMLIPVAFSSPTKGLVIASVLIDTGSMANFISDKFVKTNGLQTHKRCGTTLGRNRA
ncbi:hypothetical protein PGT21_015427 [Puccinia graminis f. sp. tritici]|uniref:Retrotransposon gag domain-containing protein n=1 Tax=Puccinia graminis f. sp. tritici TaxID=56615 RepID=A0A5B0MNT2_PUCGR|nr:hypothetical protein PGT21_015427 [Puccinia graminis f. sp. tritici]